MERRLGVLIQGRMWTLGLREFGRRGRVPSESEAIDVEEPVAGCDFMLCCQGARGVGEQFGEVVVVDLFRECMGLCGNVRMWGSNAAGQRGIRV